MAGALALPAVVAGLGLCLGGEVVGVGGFVVMFVTAGAMLPTFFAGFALMFIFLLFDRDELPWLDGCLRMVTALTPLMPLIMRMTATLDSPMLMLLDIHHQRILVQLVCFLGNEGEYSVWVAAGEA